MTVSLLDNYIKFSFTSLDNVTKGVNFIYKLMIHFLNFRSSEASQMSHLDKSAENHYLDSFLLHI